ncbi:MULTISPECIES: VOC family protein [unclassified Sphingobium]|uniref:VOC family protein n=1 Tax=unclassified Sphingobium TaxID=2611147 RepID=UPI000D151EA3|nr:MULTISPECIES: VOC family protein [unclassified Sphingobium]MBG6117901.1 putative glyoxalase superfamily protein PhnB [Sphingobium sp. JAI105]PSO12273.1 glyoxalase [Sphingobium sp. AEW4]TWD08544.1 putative glyoxalase superfamily protein PhnB [Sphingobium sp. AEW010]TWD25824.1 putative glyoxalase superfamily protein PhnB [Sphingobium sp. AEW013]TWD28340.1 putative glyoxalase superfamily protein PhnB [Sphingobium sp. AEW001]
MPGSPVIPCLRYADAPAAIDFLCEAFGFVRHAVYADDADPRIIHHAQLVLNDGMVMLGSVQDMAAESLYTWSTARDLGGVTGCVYVVVPDVDAHSLHARNEGAVVVDEPHDNDGYPGRGYSALDPEGNVWSFGSYDPWAA